MKCLFAVLLLIHASCRYYLSWRNASLNGVAFKDAALAQLQAYAVPPSGSLKLDYVSYQVPELNSKAATQQQHAGLLAGLRAVQRGYYR